MDVMGRIWNKAGTNFSKLFYENSNDQIRYENIHLAFSSLGPIARPAIPELISRLLSDETNNVSEVAAWALIHIDDPQVAGVAFDQALTNNSASARYWAAYYSSRCGTNADIVVPNLIRALDERLPDKVISQESLKAEIISALIAINNQHKQEQVIPLFVEELKDVDWINRLRAARAIGNLGKDAPQTAVPILIEMSTNDPDKTVRAGATDALKKIQASAP
jgi:HEAT repeat protein